MNNQLPLLATCAHEGGCTWHIERGVVEGGLRASPRPLQGAVSLAVSLARAKRVNLRGRPTFDLCTLR